MHWSMKSVIWLMLLTACGCGSSDLPLAQVHGTVTYRGKPLDRGTVVFFPEKGGSGVPSVGHITAGGSFEVQTGSRKGDPLGNCIVTVHCRKEADVPGPRLDRFIPATESLIPEKYADQSRSPLRFEVKAGGNDFPILLE